MTANRMTAVPPPPEPLYEMRHDGWWCALFKCLRPRERSSFYLLGDSCGVDLPAGYAFYKQEAPPEPMELRNKSLTHVVMAAMPFETEAKCFDTSHILVSRFTTDHRRSRNLAPESGTRHGIRHPRGGLGRGRQVS
jgi:hypothetical protein